MYLIYIYRWLEDFLVEYLVFSLNKKKNYFLKEEAQKLYMKLISGI